MRPSSGAEDMQFFSTMAFLSPRVQVIRIQREARTRKAKDRLTPEYHDLAAPSTFAAPSSAPSAVCEEQTSRRLEHRHAKLTKALRKSPLPAGWCAAEAAASVERERCPWHESGARGSGSGGSVRGKWRRSECAKR